MEIIFTIIGLLVALASLSYARKTYKRQFHSKPHAELQHLYVQFKITQALSLRLQNELGKFIVETNCGHKEFFQGITYNKYLEELKDSYKTHLSDEMFQRIEQLDLTSNNILSMTKSIEDQYNALSQISTYLKLQSKRFVE